MSKECNFASKVVLILANSAKRTFPKSPIMHAPLASRTPETTVSYHHFRQNGAHLRASDFIFLNAATERVTKAFPERQKVHPTGEESARVITERCAKRTERRLAVSEISEIVSGNNRRSAPI